MDVVKEDRKSVGVREEEAEDGVRLRQMIGCGPATPKERQRCVAVVEEGWFTELDMVAGLPSTQFKVGHRAGHFLLRQ